MNVLSVILLLFIVAREAMHQFTVHKLLNKLMSRNYHEYESAKEIYQPKVQLPKDHGPAEDLGILNGSPLV
jgi:hypothetical protein